MNKKILHIIGRSSYDGTCIFAYRLSISLPQYDFFYLFKHKGRAEEEIQRSNKNIFNLDTSENKNKIAIWIKAVLFFLRNRFDIIHYHSGGVVLLLISVLFRKGAKVIYHIHCGNMNCDPNKKKLSLFERILYLSINSKILKVSVADHVSEFYKENVGLSDKLITIKNSVPFEFQKKNTVSRKIGYIGQISSYKGFDEIVGLALAEPKYEIFVKGDNYYNHTGFDYNNIRFFDPSLRICEFFDSIDLFLFPSRLYEGTPLVILEAIAHDVAVICYRTKSTSEILGDYPLFVDSFSTDVLINIINKFYSNEFNRNELSDIHREINHKYSFAKMKEEIIKLYES
jgi:glycosyltransferase involved in cell wall biosynthesis